MNQDIVKQIRKATRRQFKADEKIRTVPEVPCVLLIIIMVLWSLGGCSDGSETMVGVAPVDSVEILILESFPVQVMIVARGSLPDSCTEIGSITQTRRGNKFSVAIDTLRDPSLICAQVTVLFQETVSLDVEGLPAGTYIVDVNGVRDSFALAMDN